MHSSGMGAITDRWRFPQLLFTTSSSESGLHMTDDMGLDVDAAGPARIEDLRVQNCRGLRKVELENHSGPA